VVSATNWSVLKAAQSSVVKSRIVVVDKPGMRETGMNGMTVAMVFSPAVVLVAAGWRQTAALRRCIRPQRQGLSFRASNTKPTKAR
jgi:hypothetical protein